MPILIGLLVYALCAFGSAWLNQIGYTSPPFFWMLGAMSAILPVFAAVAIVSVTEGRRF